MTRRKAHFASLGFTDAWINEVSATRPTLWAPEVVDGHLNGLAERGFTNPNKMVESSPFILGLAFENIDRRLRLYGRLIGLYDLPFSPTQLMEQEFALFSSKIDKVMVLARVAREYGVTPPQLDERMISRLLWTNLEDTLVALAEASPGEDIRTLLNRANRIKKEGIPKDEKREIIDASLEDPKIKRRYFRGYSK